MALGPIVHRAAGRPGPVGRNCTAVGAEIVVPPLRNRLAGVTQRGWEVSPAHSRRPGSRCTMGNASPPGHWWPRTPASPGSGWPGPWARPGSGASSCRRRPSRVLLPRAWPSCASVTPAERDWRVDAVVPPPGSRRWPWWTGRRLGIEVPVEAWDPEGEPLDAEAHRRRLARMIYSGAGGNGMCNLPPSLATDQGQLAELVEAAGPVVAWPQPA